MEMIKCKGLYKFYGKDKIAAVDDVNLSVEKNSVFGFLGPNGAGKTTTIKILTGLMSQSAGEVWLDGELLQKDKISFKHKIGYLGQDQKLISWMTGKELLIFTAGLFGVNSQTAKKEADILLEMAGLSNAANKKASSYSGGMLQRLGIAQAMIGNPKILFLDEPTSALDPIGRKEVLDFIHNLKTNCTVFMSTHILADVERVCDTVGIINNGKLLALEKTNELKKRYSSKIIEIKANSSEIALKLKDILSRNGGYEIIDISQNIVKIQSLENQNDKLPIIKIIADNNIEIDSFTSLDASLEDVFVKLVGGHENGK